MGPISIGLIRAFSIAEAMCKDPKEILGRSAERFKPKTNFQLARYYVQKNTSRLYI